MSQIAIVAEAVGNLCPCICKFISLYYLKMCYWDLARKIAMEDLTVNVKWTRERLFCNSSAISLDCCSFNELFCIYERLLFSGGL